MFQGGEGEENEASSMQKAKITNRICPQSTTAKAHRGANSEITGKAKIAIPSLRQSFFGLVKAAFWTKYYTRQVLISVLAKKCVWPKMQLGIPFYQPRSGMVMGNCRTGLFLLARRLSILP